MITDCRSEEGITVGVIDALITLVYLLRNRDTSPPVVKEALRDLGASEEFHYLKRITEHSDSED